MKKLFALLAVVLGVVSCMKDQSFEAGLVGDGNYVLTVALPDAATRAAGSDSAKGAIGNISLNEYDIRYTLEVYDANDELAKRDQQFSDDTSVTFALRLIPGRDYRFVVWADFVAEGTETDLHYNVKHLTNVTLTGTHNAMDESRDAYTAVKLVEGFNSASTISMELIRPFAKLRVVTNDMDEIYTTLQSAKVKYTTSIYTGFNALDAEVTGATESNVVKTVYFTEDAYKYAGEPKNGEQTLFADYLFGTEDGTVRFTLDVTDDVQALPQVTFNTNIPVQRNHLTTIYGPVLTDANEVSVKIEDAFDEPENIVTYPIEDANTLAAVLTSNEKHINATLGRDIDLPISSLGAQTPGSGEYKLGGEATETINIDLNGHKLNITTTYWSGLGAKNENALFTIKNGTMTSSQPSGTWNSYDLSFSNCNYVFEDVVFDKAIALCNVGEAVTRAEATIARKSVTMKNVTINETHDYYAMWITAEGQTVNIEGLTINSLGRGIKIDEQYVDAPAKVTLNINGADFNTKKKAAIMVKSVAGADITLSNVDIAGVAADSSNEVWVDEDAANTINKVNVIGGSMIVEGQKTVAITDMETLKEELTKAGQAGAGYTVLEISSDIDMTGAAWTPIKVDGYNGADIVTIDGKGHTIKGLTSSLFAGGSGIVIKNITIADSKMVADNTQGYGAFVNCADSMDVITLVNCHLKDSSIITPNNGANESRIGGLVGWTAGYNKQNDGPVDSYITIENCSVVNCTLKGAGSIGAICGHAGANAATFTNIKDCTITNNKLISTDDGGWRTGVVVGTANNGQCVISNITESGNTLTQASASDFKNPTGATRHYYGRFVPAGTGHLTIDGVEITAGITVIADGVFKKDGEKAYYINNAAGLVYISNNAPESGAAVKLDADINLEGVEFNGLMVQNWSGKNTFDGQNHTVSNWTYNGGAIDMGFIRQWVGPVKNVKFENCHLKTGGRSAVVAGKIYGNIDNVSVNNCSIEDSYWACGIIAGLYNAGSVSNCTVTNSSVKSNGGTGAIVGVFNEEGGERGLKNCSVSNTTINNTGVYGEVYTGGALVGMFNSGATFTIEGCTVSNNTLEGGYVYEKYPADESVTIIEK